jgi:hypothetical protein
MDIDYFINILQQTNEEIKHLKQQINNLKSITELQNKTINELLFEGGNIFGYSFDSCHLITNDNRPNSDNRIMTKRQLEIIISALPRFNKLYSLKINSFNYENLKKLNIISNTLKHLSLTPKYCVKYSHDNKIKSNSIETNVLNYPNEPFEFYTMKFTLDGIEQLPNLTSIRIEFGYGLYNLCQTLSSVPHKITNIELVNCFYCRSAEHIHEKNKIEQYCELNNIKHNIYDTIFVTYSNYGELTHSNYGELTILNNDDKMFVEE